MYVPYSLGFVHSDDYQIYNGDSSYGKEVGLPLFGYCGVNGQRNFGLLHSYSFLLLNILHHLSCISSNTLLITNQTS